MKINKRNILNVPFDPSLYKLVEKIELTKIQKLVLLIAAVSKTPEEAYEVLSKSAKARAAFRILKPLKLIKLQNRQVFLTSMGLTALYDFNLAIEGTLSISNDGKQILRKANMLL